MARRKSNPFWPAWQRALGTLTRSTLRSGTQVLRETLHAPAPRALPPGKGDWVSGIAMGPAGVRKYHLYKPPGVRFSERLPLLVMLHGCGQDARGFAQSTRMNRLAARERFFVLYPEQDRRANPQGCWNWYDTRSGQAYGEAATLRAAIDQVCQLYPIDPERVAVAGLSAGASMGALLASRYPGRFQAVVMHSGIAPGAAHSTLSALHAMRGTRPPEALAAQGTWPPLLVIHGGADAVVAAKNGRAAVRVWADAAGARAATPRQVCRGKRYAMSVTDFKVRGSTVATLCEVDALGHAWSGGDARHAHGDERGPDASRMVWAFVARQFARRAGVVGAA